MPYDIRLAPEAVDDRDRLDARWRATLDNALKIHLRNEPTKTSRSRIKRLRGLARPQYRLRVDDFRVFYDVTETEVQVLAIVRKAEVTSWLERKGKKDEEGSPIRDQGSAVEVPPRRRKGSGRHHPPRKARRRPHRL